MKRTIVSLRRLVPRKNRRTKIVVIQEPTDAELARKAKQKSHADLLTKPFIPIHGRVRDE